ncbi:hypothetical protein Plhal304r1_c031g0099721 [Plasmopara halstedii]
MWLSHVLIAAKVVLLVRGNQVVDDADCAKTHDWSQTPWLPSFSFNNLSTGTMQPADNSMPSFGSWNPWLSFSNWNMASPSANGAPESEPPSIKDDDLIDVPSVDDNSVEQQTLETPAVQTDEVTMDPPIPTTDNSEMPAVQLPDDSTPPPVEPSTTPIATEAKKSTANPPAASSPSSSVKPSKSANSNRTATSDNSKLCAKMRVKISEVDLSVAVDANEDEVNLKVVAIAALPSGGSIIAVHSGDTVIVRKLDENDELVSTSDAVTVPMHDFADIYADDDGFVLLGTRDAEGGGTLNCGNPSNLCGEAPNPSVPCYDMYLIRYDGSSETWATKLTSSSTSLPPYSSGKTGPDVYMIWWYAHHGRIASDGTNWAAYFGCAISTSENGCINIHQGDRMKVVDPSGKILTQKDSFDWGCSHSGYERLTFDDRKKGYTSICKTDNNNRIMPPNDWSTTIYPVDLAASNLGDIVPDSQASGTKYWTTVSNGNGENAKVHLIHFAINSASDDDITLGGDDANERAPHLASIGEGGLLAMWEGSSAGGDLVEGGDRQVYAQVLDGSTGKTISSKETVAKSVVGNRYQALKSFPDGTVAYLSKGTTDTSVQVVRFFGC